MDKARVILSTHYFKEALVSVKKSSKHGGIIESKTFHTTQSPWLNAAVLLWPLRCWQWNVLIRIPCCTYVCLVTYSSKTRHETEGNNRTSNVIGSAITVV